MDTDLLPNSGEAVPWLEINKPYGWPSCRFMYSIKSWFNFVPYWITCALSSFSLHWWPVVPWRVSVCISKPFELQIIVGQGFLDLTSAFIFQHIHSYYKLQLLYDLHYVVPQNRLLSLPWKHNYTSACGQPATTKSIGRTSPSQFHFHLANIQNGVPELVSLNYHASMFNPENHSYLRNKIHKEFHQPCLDIFPYLINYFVIEVRLNLMAFVKSKRYLCRTLNLG